MPLMMKDFGRVSGPCIVCDVCNGEIADAKDGNCEWKEPLGGSTKLFAPIFTHKLCAARSPKGGAGDGLGCWIELSHFMVYLRNNLKVNMETAERGAAMMASVEI